MNTEFHDMLGRDVREGRMTPEQRDDRRRAEIEQQHPHRVVGYVNGTRVVGSTVHEILTKAKERYPGRMVYLEPVGTELFKEPVKLR